MCNCAQKEETRRQEAPDPVAVFDKQGIKTCFLYVNIWDANASQTPQRLRAWRAPTTQTLYRNNMGAGQMYGFSVVKKKFMRGITSPLIH